MERSGCCLTIGGSDSCGGAGIQADLRVFHRYHQHGCSAITALTAQNPDTIRHIEAVSLKQLQAELNAIFDYYHVKAVKTGMLWDASRIALVSDVLRQRHQQGILVVDPVLVASSGRRLLDAAATDSLLEHLLPLATVITPNLDEAAVLTGISAADDELELASQLLLRCRCAVLLKGGHAKAEQLRDLLLEPSGDVHVFTHSRQRWSKQQAHGTGCRIAAAIAALLANGMPLPQACEQSITALQQCC